MKSTIFNIKNNTTQVFESIVGDIKKIFILTEAPMYHVSLTFKTNEGETIYKPKLEQPITVIYPWNFVHELGQGFPYYSQGDIFMEIENLDNQEIKQVTIFYQ